MAQVTLKLGEILVEIEDEDSGHRPLARKAASLVADLVDHARRLALEEDDEEVEDGE